MIEQAGWRMLARLALVLTCHPGTQVCPRENIFGNVKSCIADGHSKVDGVSGDRRLMEENNSFRQALKEADLNELVT